MLITVDYCGGRCVSSGRCREASWSNRRGSRRATLGVCLRTTMIMIKMRMRMRMGMRTTMMMRRRRRMCLTMMTMIMCLTMMTRVTMMIDDDEWCQCCDGMGWDGPHGCPYEDPGELDTYLWDVINLGGNKEAWPSARVKIAQPRGQQEGLVMPLAWMAVLHFPGLHGCWGHAGLVGACRWSIQGPCAGCRCTSMWTTSWRRVWRTSPKCWAGGWPLAKLASPLRPTVRC